MSEDKKQRLKEIKLTPLKKTELLIVTVGDLRKNILPTTEMLLDIQKVVSEALNSPTGGVVFVPPFVKFKKMKFKGSGKDGKTEKLDDTGRKKYTDK